MSGEVVSVSFTSVVFESLAGLGVGVEVVSGDSGGTASDSDVSGLATDVVLAGTAEGFSLVDCASPGGDRGTVVSGGALSVAGTSSGGSVGLLPDFSTIRAGFDSTVILAILLCSEVVAVSVTAVEGVGLASSGSTVVVPSGDSRSTNGSGLGGEGASVSLSGTATIGGSVVVAVIVGGASCCDGSSSTTNNEVSVGISQCSSLDTLWFTSGITAIVLARSIRIEIICVTLASRIDEFFTVSSLGVEPPAVTVCTTVTLFTGEFTNVLRTGTADSSKGSGSRSRFARVSGRTAVGSVSCGRAFHVPFSTGVLEGFTSTTED